MVMWVSKSLGRGFRVGTTIRTRPTQAQLKILENAKFIENIQKRFREAFADYLLQNGYYVADMQDLAGAEIEDDVYNPVKISLDEFKDVMRLIQDGGNLTEKRKERLLKSVYGIEDLLTSKNTLKELREKFNKYNKEWSLFSSEREKIKARKEEVLNEIKLHTKKFISQLPEENSSAIPVGNNQSDENKESFFQKHPKLSGFLLSFFFCVLIGVHKEIDSLAKICCWNILSVGIFYFTLKKDFIQGKWLSRIFIILGVGYWFFVCNS